AATVTPPTESVRYLDDKSGVELMVRSTGKSPTGTFLFLNSETDHRNDKNFTVVIGKKALEQFKKQNIADPLEYFKGKTVRVKGAVTKHQNRPQIEITGPEQIEIVLP